MTAKVLTLLILCFTSAAVAEDFTTVNGKEYKEATVTRVDPDGIVVKTKSGITKVYFTELPRQVQERFHYDSAKAASYSSEQTANYTAYQKQQEQTQRQQAEADAKNKAIFGTTGSHESLSRLAGPLQRASDAGGRFASSNQSGEATRAGVPEG